MADEEKTIKNRALGLIGAPRLSSLTEISGSQEILDDHWVGIRKEFAGLTNWDGCTTISALVEEVTAVIPDRWKRAWTLPTDFAGAWKVNDLAEGAGASPLWEIFALPGESPVIQVLLTDQNNARLEHSFDPNTDARLALLSGGVTTALVHLLAVAIARPWGKQEGDIALLEALYQRKLNMALFTNGKQQKRKADRARPLVDARTNRARFGRPL